MLGISNRFGKDCIYHLQGECAVGASSGKWRAGSDDADWWSGKNSSAFYTVLRNSLRIWIQVPFRIAVI